MFGWLQELIDAIVNAIIGGFKSAANEVTNSIWNLMLKWLYNSVYSAIADFFTMMGNMGAEIFDLAWIQAIVKLFTLFGWGLFTAGVVVAVFDLAIEFQSGRANVKNTMLNILKGFFACSLIGIVPIELYKFCISLQNTFADELARIFSWGSGIDFATRAGIIFGNAFSPVMINNNILLNTLLLIAFAYCIVKVFFQNIKRGGILLVQMSVGSLYMFSVPRGYSDGFTQWMKQVAALCLTAFMQTTLLFAGLMTFSVNMLLGLGIMLAASEVPRIAQQFGLDSSTKFNMMSAVHATTTAINLTRAIAMTERPLMSADELKAMPKGQFVVMKTGAHPMKVRLKLFFDWGISFGEPYAVKENANRKVEYAEKKELIEKIVEKYCPDLKDETEEKSKSRGGIGGQTQVESRRHFANDLRTNRPFLRTSSIKRQYPLPPTTEETDEMDETEQKDNEPT